MIYLIKVDYRNETLLKIGYTSNLNNRKSQYKTHNPGAEFLKIRKGGTDLEAFMHHYFSKYAYPDCPEWFYYNQEIVDKFDTLEIMIESRIVIDKLKSIMRNNLCNSKVFNDIDEEFKNDDNSKTRAYETIKSIREFYLNYINNELEYNGLPEYLPYNPLIEFDASLFDDKKVLVSLGDIISIPHNYFRIGKGVVYNQDSQKRLSILSDKIISTKKLLQAYEGAKSKGEDVALELAKTYKKLSRTYNYKDNYIAVNRNESGNLDPEFNRLVLLAEYRAFQIQKIDYSDRFSVFNSINNSVDSKKDMTELEKEIRDFYNEYNNVKDNVKKTLELYYSDKFSDETRFAVYNSLISIIKSYITLGEQKIRSAKFVPSVLDRLLEVKKSSEMDIDKEIYLRYRVGDKLAKSQLKKGLQGLYDKYGLYRKAKATDIGEWFAYSIKKIIDPNTGKRVDGLELGGVKKIIR